jgi:acyl-homoserine-lactone acylase
MFRFLSLAFALLTFVLSADAQINPNNVDIVRDKWGVPHIYGKTDADATYGLAWAVCEDDFTTIQKMLLAVKGRLAETDGKGGAILDMLSFISGAEAIVDTLYDKTFSPQYKKVVDGYTQGINDYAAAHPSEVARPGLFPVSQKTIIAQYILTNMLLTGVYLDVQKVFLGDIKAYEVNLPSGSNAFAISSSRTKDGQTYLAINSHQPLEGLFSWYEAHMVSEEGMNILGGTFPGGMNIFLGTTPNLGWACTLNNPDLDDVYKLEMNPKHRLQYKFDGHWETLQVRKKTVKVKLGAIRIPVTKTFYWSKYGTTLKNKDGFYSIRFPANMDIRGSEALYHLNKAKNFSEWRSVMAQNAFPGVNFIYADRTDTTYYVSNGQFADRNPKYNWKKVLPGNTSETLWNPPFLGYENLPQVLNPKSGYIVNTNNSCFEASGPGDNCDIKKINPTYGFGCEKNNRSIMAHHLLAQQDKFSYEEFKKVKFNREWNDSMYESGLPNIPVLFNLNPEKYPDLADAIAVLKKWNHGTDPNNKQAALISFSFYPLIDKITSHGRENEENYFTEKEYAQALRNGKKHMLKYFGGLEVPLGTVQKHARGNVEIPIGGMPEVLAANVTQPYKNGMRRTFVGESYIELVRYSKDTVLIETVNAFGASTHLNSPHSTDQMQMYVDQKLKPMTLNRDKIYSEAENVYHPVKQTPPIDLRNTSSVK